MPSRLRCVRQAVALVALALVPTLTLAANKHHSVEFGGAYTFIRFDPDGSLDARSAPSLILGYNFTKRHGAELLFTSTTATPDTGPSVGVDVDILRLGYTFNAYPREKLVSFFRAGLGVMALDPQEDPSVPEQEKDTRAMMYSGGGVRMFITERFAIRLAGTIEAIETGNGLLSGDVQATGELGAVFIIGGSEPAEKKAPEEPPAEGSSPEGEQQSGGG